MRTLNIMTVSLLMAAQTQVWGGYLSKIGPSPLRFEKPAKARITAVNAALTPAAIQPSGASSTNLEDAVGFFPGTNRLIEGSVVHTAQSPEPLDPATWDSLLQTRDFGLGSGTQSTNFVSPQMMLYFFERNSAEGAPSRSGVVAPVPFVPPVATPRPGSRSTLVLP
jgi:hypothetical protein